MKAHPAWKVQFYFIQTPSWETTTKGSYVDPKTLVDPLIRDSGKCEYRKQPALSSGYSTNRAYWDGTGWSPEKVLKP